MISLFENLDVASADFSRSQLFAGLNIPSVVIHDDGFLPKEVDPPIKFYCKVTDQNTPLYFGKVKISKFYRIVATAQKGEIFDLHQKKADIVFAATDNSQLVKKIRWLDDKGQLSWIDHYDREGKIFAKTYINNGQEVLWKYSDNEGKAVIVHYLVAGDILLSDNDEARHFSDLVQFIQYYLRIRHYEADHIFYNTLNQSMFVGLGVGKKGSDTLLWHEKLDEELPGNMTYLSKNGTRAKHVVFESCLD